MSLRCGVDVGGTHTDAVLLSAANTVVATAKAKTSCDTVTGIVAVLDKLAELAPNGEQHFKSVCRSRKTLLIRLGGNAWTLPILRHY